MNWQDHLRHRKVKEGSDDSQNLRVEITNYLQVLERAIKSLSVTDQQIAILRFIYGLPIARIADRLKISWFEAEYLVHRVRCSLLQDLKTKETLIQIKI